ncbi:MAG: hypothetical protein ABI488_06370 [Polyangiaceae bacterium]
MWLAIRNWFQNGRIGRRWERRCALGMLLGLSGFAGFLAAAMALYPGGNWLDRAAPGHRFFANFLCDLTQPIALSGVKNSLAAGLAQTGLLFFAFALAGFFAVLPQHFSVGSRAARWVRGLGECAALCFGAVPLTPSERFGKVHAVLALGSGALGIAAALCAVWALFASKRRALATLGVLSLVAGVAEAGLFVYYLSDTTPPPLEVPAMQKVAALLLSAWIAAVAARVLLDPTHSRHDVGPLSTSPPPPPSP